MERVSGCQELGCCSVVCLGFDGSIGFESDGSMRCVAIVFPMPLVGRPAFIGQRKARVTVEGKEEHEKEKKALFGFYMPS